MTSLLSQHGMLLHRATMALTGHCEALRGALGQESLPASPHSQVMAVEAATAFLMQRLGLTRRRAEVLHWIAEGKTNEEIRLILGCSFFTVKNHIKKIFQHLSVHSRTAAACAYRAHIADALTGPARRQARAS